jgi:hypothetical protein
MLELCRLLLQCRCCHWQRQKKALTALLLLAAGCC